MKIFCQKRCPLAPTGALPQTPPGALPVGPTGAWVVPGPQRMEPLLRQIWKNALEICKWRPLQQKQQISIGEGQV